MPSSPSKMELGSWKEIAAYIAVNVRTAQKWEKSRGLPVRRLPGQKGRVVANPEDLDRWKAEVGDRPRWWNDSAILRWYSLMVSAAAVALLGWAVAERRAGRHPGEPSLYRVEQRTLVVMDASGRQLWSHSFDDPFAYQAYEGGLGLLRTAFADVDGDGRTELLFAYYSVRADTEGVDLYCFSDTGQSKWKFSPGRAVRDGEHVYPGPYIVTAFAFVDLGGKAGRAVAVTSRHAVYYPNQFVILDAKGRPRGEYWHSGHLDNLAFADLDGDGVKEVLLSGVNNGHHAAALIALDARDFTGASDQGAASRYQIRDLPLHKERALVLFPPTCMNRKLALYNMAYEVFTADGPIRVHVRENEPREFVIYTLDNQLRCIRAEATDGYRVGHMRMEAQRVLDHPLTDAEIEGWRQAVRRE